MKVVIAGAGEVGTHLAKMLARENHDIVLIDDNPERLVQASHEIDLLTIYGSAHSFHDLKQAGMSNSDLFIAVTTSEERNVLACTMASYLGVGRTIARINNSEYLMERYKQKLNNLGVNELIYPESLAAKEIIASIRHVGTRQIIEFSKGKLFLLGIKIRENAPMVNKTIEELDIEKDNITIVAINRNNETIIPKGSEKLINGDIVFFVTNKQSHNQIFELTGKTVFEVKNIMFLGGSRIAQRAVEKLGDQYRIKIIESNLERCQYLAEKFSNALIINGDCRDLNLLKEEGIGKMDAIVTTTGNSETNILSCHLAKSMGVKRTVAEVENLAFMGIAENMDIGSLINKKLIAASYIYKYTMNAEISNVKCLTASDAEVFEFIVKPDAKIAQKLVKNLDFPEESKIGGYIRNDHGNIARGDTQLQVGDKVVVFTLPSGIKKLEKYFR